MAGAAVEKHGAHAVHVRKRYNDGRSREGKRLKSIIDGLIRDLGGGPLNRAQELILEGIKSKIIITLQISKYINENMGSIVSKQGELLPVLRNDYNMYAESLRRDLETLFLMKRTVKHSDYEKAVEALQGKGIGI